MKDNTKLIVFGTIFLAIILVIAFISFKVTKDKKLYVQDVQHLYEVAGKLGYTQQNYLNFNRSQAYGIDAAYDTIELLFFTKQSLEEFSAKVDNLQLPPLGDEPKTRRHDKRFSFLYEPWDKLKKNLVLRSVSTQKSQDPYVTSWLLWDSPYRRSLNIEYADLNGEESIWEYNDKKFEGAIVVVDINIWRDPFALK